jgi:hypothetical protein
MTILIAACTVSCAAEAVSAEPARGTTVPVCTTDQLKAHTPTYDEIAAHRQFELPVIDYPFGTKLTGNWGMVLTTRVNESGKAVCYSVRDAFGRIAPLNAQQRAVIPQVRDWNYSPFMSGGQAVPAIVSELIRGQERVGRHIPLPKVAPDKVHISLERTACLGSCPVYKVDVYGDGRIVYRGEAYADVLGKHSFRVPPEEVAHLVESLRDKDIWSLRSVYRGEITDQPGRFLTMDLGGVVHRIEDYAGSMVGMRSSVSEFEREIDTVARSAMWMHVSSEAIAHLEAENFDFRSRAGADLLARAVADEEGHDDEAMLSLINLGTPLGGAASSGDWPSERERSVLELALENHRAILIEPLLSMGALNTGGRPDQDKIDAAFLAAIEGGRLELVQRIWQVPGSKAHPSLSFDSVTGNENPVHRQAPVTLALTRPARMDSNWEGLAITKWLAALGCDLKASKADGTTLLHIAAETGNAELVRYLLSQGMDASTPGRFGLPPLSSTQDEEVAMILLEAGTDPSRLVDGGRNFRAYAEGSRWQRVVAWLDAHGR